MPESPARSEGFTLVELMVVLVIIALAAAAVMLAWPDRGGSLVAEAERFAARAKAARDRAILESRTTAVRLGPGGYDVARRIDGAWRTEARHDWAEGTRPGTAASVRFDSTGLAEPARIVLSRGDRRAIVDIGGDGSINVRR